MYTYLVFISSKYYILHIIYFKLYTIVLGINTKQHKHFKTLNYTRINILLIRYNYHNLMNNY